MQKGRPFMKEKERRQIRIPETLRELYAGIAVLSILLQVTVVWFVEDRLSYSLGLWIGAAAAMVFVWHMWRTLDLALELGEAGAQKVMRRQAVIRYGLVAGVLGLLMLTRAANPLAAFLGIMTLKVAAYLQPVTHKAILKLRR